MDKREALPEVVDDLLRQRKVERAEALMAALLSDEPPPCLCGRHNAEQCEQHGGEP